MNYTLMNVDMTKAILDGRKVQTRRVVKTIHPIDGLEHLNEILKDKDYIFKKSKWGFLTPKYQIGETIWVREPAYVQDLRVAYDDTGSVAHIDCVYIADRARKTIKVPERFNENNWNNFPKWIENHQGIPNGCIKEMARIFLKITDVRVELLQDITFGDIIKEGYPYKVLLHHKILKHKAITAENEHEKDILNWWIKLWDSTAKAPYKWANNPYTFVNGLKRVEK